MESIFPVEFSLPLVDEFPLTLYQFMENIFSVEFSFPKIDKFTLIKSQKKYQQSQISSFIFQKINIKAHLYFAYRLLEL